MFGLPMLTSRTDAAAICAAALCLIDGAMTLPHWQLEGNPVVLALGPLGMMLVKTVTVAALLWLCFQWRVQDQSTLAAACIWVLCSIYTAAVITNVVVLLVL